MQTLTIPASITKRKQACRSCRQRKKKCDAERPECALCKKLGIKCDYTATFTHDQIELQPQILEGTLPFQQSFNHAFNLQGNGLDFMRFPGMNFDAFSTGQVRGNETDPNAIDYPTPKSGPIGLSAEDTSGFSEDLLANFQLPDDALLVELATLFFDHIYLFFPCFHKQRFFQDLRSGHFQKEVPLLLYAICCIASRHHPDPAVRNRQGDWYEQAKLSYNLTQRLPDQGLRTIQAVLLLVHHAFTIGDFSSSWLFLGKAWRQAVALGMNRVDASHAVHVRGQSSIADDEKIFDFELRRGKTVVEQEEYRRTLWMLFIMDRNHAWPTGWPNAITELQFKVDIPVADTLFQALDPDLETKAYTNTAFTRNLNRLINSSSSAREPLNTFHYILITHVLLGRVSELVHSLHDQPDTLEYAEECQELDSFMVKFRLSLPREATSVFETPAAERGHVVWLNVMLNLIAILLHYRCSQDVPVPNPPSQFALAVAAARNTAQIVKDASRFSIDYLLSAHTGAALYIAACVLVLQWRETSEDALKEEIDLIELVFDRMNDMFVFLGLKFKLALQHDLNRSEADILSLKERGFRGLLADCSKWTYVKEELHRRGINIAIT